MTYKYFIEFTNPETNSPLQNNYFLIVGILYLSIGVFLLKTK